MKSLIIALIVTVSSLAQAADLNSKNRIQSAVELLGKVAEDTQSFQLKSRKDPKRMLLELALKLEAVESKEDFDDNWTSDGYVMWQADSMAWGLDTAESAYAYVESSLASTLESGARSAADKIKYAEGVLKAKRAFEILKSIGSVKFAAAPIGAVQCGVTLPALIILDTENGVAHQVVMDPSGC